MQSFTPWKHSALTLSLGTLSLASSIPSRFRLARSVQDLVARDDPWPWGVVGDSWGSGVSYNQDVLYDDNRDNCLRTKESHGPQMEADTNWGGHHDPSGLRDAACSGAQLVDIVLGQQQMTKVGDSPALVVMTSGGNNAGFGHIVDVCIYHSDPQHDYGEAYGDDTDKTGDCAKALNDASDYINNPDKMANDLTRTLSDVLNAPASKNPDFLLYLTGYARFFDPGYDAWCDKEYWSIPSLANPFSKTPYLSTALRQAFNDRVGAVNDLYSKIASSDQFKDKVRYIDLDSAFQGHRFCEPGASHADQLNTDTNFDKVYLWNLNYPWQVSGSGAPSDAAAAGNPSAQDIAPIFPAGGSGGVTAWGSGGGEGNVPGNGWRLRPFHPRYTGYTAIKNAIFAQMTRDGIPKAGGGSSTNPTPVQCYHAADPDNTCAAIANGPGWCDCGDSNKYIIDPSGQPCPWTTLPATTSWDCSAAGPTDPAPQPSQTQVAPSPTPTPPDLNSPACQTCTTNLGASNCAASDDACLVAQCQADTNCQTCGIDCNSFGNI